MINVLKSFAAKVWVSVLLLLVVAGVLVGSTRILLPLVSEYRAQLAADIGSAIGAPVRIDRLGARLAGLSPELRLSGVEILDPDDGQVQLRFRELRLRLGLWDSLRSGQPRIGLATLVGARLVLRRRSESGPLTIGFDTTGEATAGEPADFTLAPFLSEGRLRLLDGEIHWHDPAPGLPPLSITGVEAQLVNAGMRHQVEISGHIAGSDAQLQLHADLFGEPDTMSDWRGEIHCSARSLRLGPLVRPFLPRQYPLEAKAELILWSRWSGGRPQAVEAKLALSDARLGDALLAEHLSAGLEWRRQGEQDWRLGLAGLELWRGERTHPTTDLTLWSRGQAGARQLQFGLQRLRLDDLLALAALLPLESEQQEILARLQPRGELLELRVILDLSDSTAPRRWQVAGRLQGLSLQPMDGAPGVRGLDLELSMDQEHGIAVLASNDLELEFPDLFRWPLTGERLSGDLHWRYGERGLQIHSDEILLDTPDIATRSRLRLDLPADDAPRFIDLQTDYRDADGTATSRYLPAGILSEELVGWLDKSIVSGHVPSGSFILRGPLADWPYYGREGQFQVLFGAEHVILDYQDGWPRLEEVVAEVHFNNESLEILAQDARLLGSRVRHARAWLPDLDKTRHVFIKGAVTGPFSDSFRILRETSLAENKARYVAGMNGRGRAELRLDMAIPVEDGEDYRVDGRVLWRKNASLLLEDRGLALEALQGALTFNEAGVFADDIRARLWDLPVQARVHTDDGGEGRDANTRISLELPLRPATLAREYPHVGWQHLHGSAPARLTLDIDHGSDRNALPVHYRLDSELNGILVDLPAPLGKAAAQQRSLFIAGDLPVQSGDELQIGYGDIQGAFRLQQDPHTEHFAVDAGVVHCGTRHTPKVARSGFILGGHLPELDAGAWADWLAQHAPRRLQTSDERRNPSRRVDLAIDKLRLPRGSLNDVLLAMLRTPNAWEADIRSRELEGEIRLPDGDRHKPLSVQLKTLRLDPEQWESIAETDAPAQWPDPRRASGLYLSVEELYLGGRPFGRLDIKAMPVPEGLHLTQFSLDGPLLTLAGEGSWLGDTRKQHSTLDLKGGSADLGRTLRELNFTTALGHSVLDFEASLNWPAPLLEPGLDRVQGKLQFHIGEGRILDVDPGVGRLFGLLNLGALNRRLTLDFTDLFKEGYAFDSIDARFSIGGGNALAEAVEIVGPAADLSISGRTGLLTQDYQQVVTVTPEISATLPLAGALAGGPVVAAALLLAEQVMGEEVNKLIRYQYSVTGPWNDPQIERIETQDGWSLSNLLRPAGEQSEPAATPGREEAGLFVH